MGENPVVVKLGGRIDSGNSARMKEEILQASAGRENDPIVLDLEELDYISSSGLRVIVQIRKTHPEMSVINVKPGIYEIFEVTGFTEIMPVQKAYREVSVEGCEIIGEGANGVIYRLDRENVVKVYNDTLSLDDIRHEREMAKSAFILGIPTAISYSVVKVGDRYGSVFELLDSKSFAKILATEPERMDWCVREYTDMLKTIHATVVPEGKLPSIKALALEWTGRMKSDLPGPYAEKLERMIRAIPEQNTMIHGDYHIKNIVLAAGEVMLVDMDTLSVGNPVFELAQMYNSYVGFGENDPDAVQGFLSCDAQTAGEFWKKSLRAYLEETDEDRVREAEDKIRCVSYVRLIDWNRRHKVPPDAKSLADGELWIRELTELLGRVDSLDL